MGKHGRLAIGTVQFGLRYGVANQSGQVGVKEAAAILDRAWRAGVDTVDTAIAYGESEKRLGEIGMSNWRVITKLPAFPGSGAEVAAWVRRSVNESITRLQIGRLAGLLFHQSQQLLGPYGREIHETLLSLQGEGSIEKIGVSVYDPEELDALWPFFQPQLVQAPFNILDRRIASSGWLGRLHESGTEVHVRSIFLQGLLLMGPTDRPQRFNPWHQLWRRWHALLEEQRITPLEACLGFVFPRAEIDRVVVGIDSLTQLEEILAGVDAPGVEIPASLASEDPDLINPSRWNAT